MLISPLKVPDEPSDSFPWMARTFLWFIMKRVQPKGFQNLRDQIEADIRAGRLLEDAAIEIDLDTIRQSIRDNLTPTQEERPAN